MKTYSAFLTELRNPSGISRFRDKVKHIDKVDNRVTDWTGTIYDIMTEYGWDQLGSGKYGSVFGKANYPYVLKVFMKDSAYMRWIAYCLKNKNNPYIPKVRGKVVKITDTFFAIRLEKLSDRGDSVEFFKEYETWQKDNSYVPDDKNLADIFKFFKKNKNLLDIHGENVMFRGKQLVISDPFYNWFGKQKPGQFAIDPDEIDDSLF